VKYEGEPGWLRASARPIAIFISVKIRGINEALLDERGQDLIEYALIVALLALAATASLSAVAASISKAFSKVGHTLSTYTS